MFAPGESRWKARRILAAMKAMVAMPAMKAMKTVPAMKAMAAAVPVSMAMIFALPLQAQSPEPPSAEHRSYTTRRIDGARPQIDGRIDETVWETVPWTGDFTQHSPNEGAPPSQPTEFKILYDDEALYVAYRAWDEEPGRIKRQSL